VEAPAVAADADAMMSAASRDPALEAALRLALDDAELFLVYQPQFDLRSDQLTGAEALIRWRHPLRGVIAPATFLPAAEASGQIVPIGEWVLRTACRRAARWRRGERPVGISVNLSLRQLADDGIVVAVSSALSLSGLDPAALTLEVSESAIAGDVAVPASRLRELKDVGVRIAIDNFGGARWSMSYLSGLPVDALKIDRAFVSGTVPAGDAAVLIGTIVKIGKLLGLQVLGVGIESEAQLEQLRGLDCDGGQGYLLGRPVSAEWIEELLADAEAQGVARISSHAA
jgi:EAL domain-containing protein (putative c-di-GMP-specific phosphodiesterase class I)